MADCPKLGDDMTDMDFEKLFSALDSIKASDELKGSTLDAIFSAAPTADQPDDATPKVVELPHKPKLVGGKGKHSKKNNSRRLRIAGVAACLAIFGVGTVAYHMPTSYACVEDGDTTLTLGINSFGVTVSATADSDRGKALIADSDVNNKNYRDAVGTVASAIADSNNAEGTSINLSVSSEDRSQRDAIKKGSSEAIEISGYKKRAPLAKGNGVESSEADKKSASKPASSSTADNDAGTIATDADANGNVSTFEIDTDHNEKKATSGDQKADASEGSGSKYHPLADDKDKSASSEPSEQTESSPAVEQESSGTQSQQSAE